MSLGQFICALAQFLTGVAEDLLHHRKLRIGTFELHFNTRQRRPELGPLVLQQSLQALARLFLTGEPRPELGIELPCCVELLFQLAVSYIQQSEFLGLIVEAGLQRELNPILTVVRRCSQERLRRFPNPRPRSVRHRLTDQSR